MSKFKIYCYCIKDYYNYFKTDNIYTYYICDKYENDDLLVMRVFHGLSNTSTPYEYFSVGGLVRNGTFPYGHRFYEYFADFKEYRKLKLDKLNGKVCI